MPKKIREQSIAWPPVVGNSNAARGRSKPKNEEIGKMSPIPARRGLA